jgi:serine/threonine protein kinase
MKYEPGNYIADRYRVRQRTSGGMSRVYIAEDIATDKVVVIKTLLEDNKNNLERHNDTERFLAESRTWIQLERHPNIVQAKSTFIADDQPFLVVEFIEGGSLRDHIAAKRLDLRGSLDLIIQFCEGAEYAYRKIGLIHRDVKPENLLLTGNNILKITDFGLSRTGIERHTKGVVAGTMPYMSPEHWVDAEAVTKQSDIYSLGVVIYEILTGKRPFYSENYKGYKKAHQEQIPPNPKSINPRIADEMSEIIMRCLEKNPILRFLSYEELSEQVRGFYEKYVGEAYSFPLIKDTNNAPLSQTDLLNSGDSLAAIGKYGDALRYYDLLLETNYESAKFWQRKAEVLMKLSKFAEAEMYYDKSLKIEPSFMDSIIGKIECLTLMNRSKEALKLCNSALVLNPDDKTLLKIKQRYIGSHLEGRSKDLLGSCHENEESRGQEIHSSTVEENKLVFPTETMGDAPNKHYEISG